MFDETSRSHTDDDSTRHIHRGHRPPEEKTVEVDSAAFFAPETAAPTPPPAPPKPPKHTGGPAPESKPPRRRPDADTGAANPKRGTVLLIVQAILSIAAFFQLWRTQMLPALYLVIIAALLVLFWLLVKRCQEYSAPRKVSRVFSVFLCAFLALGCVWAQQGLSALDNVTSGLVTGTEANKITKEPFVVYLSGVDNRGELTEKARSDVNILAVVNPSTKRVALINTPRDYYVDLAGTNSKDKLTHAGLYGVETSMATLGNLYGVNVDQYLRINFAGFISIIDAVGGVDVYSDQAFTSVGSPGYYDPTTFVEGWNHLDGKAALAFARERHAFASGDIQRGINQMKVIDAMLNKIKSPALLMGFSKIMDAAADCFVTSFSQDQISALVRMQLSDFAEWDIESYTVTGTSSSSTKCYSAKGQKLYVMKPDDASVSKAREMIASVLGGEGTVADTTQKPEKTDVFTPTTDPNAAVSEVPAESVPEEVPADSLPEETVPADQPAEQPATEGTPFSTPGNGQLVDDKENDNTKQFLTVQTKNGNTFYMVIDRSGTSENVYMMSLVDENDLAEFLDETKETEKKEESAVVLPETTTTPEPETTAQPETEVKQESGINKMIGWIALGAVATLALGGLGMFAFGKLRKKKEDGIVEEGLEFADDSYINEDEENAENQQK